MVRSGKRALVAFLFLTAACAGGSNEPSAPSEPAADEPRSGSDDDSAEPADKSDKAKHEKGSGWRWKGKREDCFYVHDNECFATKKAACSAAGCGVSTCSELEDTAPIKVRCSAASDD